MLARLRQARKVLKQNQTDFARTLGITQTAYSMIENGINPLQERHIKVLCSAYRISERWLASGEGEMLEGSGREKELVEIFGTLAPSTRRFLMDQAKAILQEQERPGEKETGPG